MVQSGFSLKYLTFHDRVSRLSSPDAQGLEHFLESVLGLVLGREDERGGLLAAVTHPDGGQELLEVGTLGCDLQSGGGGHQSGPPVDAHILESGHGSGGGETTWHFGQQMLTTRTVLSRNIKYN